jgi:methylated-DNA-[protein]-cysteine S-methyltransferase
MQDQRHGPTMEPGAVHDKDAFPDVVEQLVAYFAGELTDFDVKLRLAGTTFQRRVWSALAEIPYGETMSYGELAQQIGQPSAFRAVGLANGRNPVAIIVPCHRVIGSSGALIGYGGGLDRKRLLLDLERSHAQPGLGGLALVL